MSAQSGDLLTKPWRQDELLEPTTPGGTKPPVMEQPEVRAGSIVIVDDHPGNLKVLGDILRQDGYQVRSFARGGPALVSVDEDPPDLVLLDINMPEMSGYEVCERLKSNPKRCDIPVIFLSGLSEAQDKVKAFRSGAVDYIPKPFQFQEVHARVEAHLKLHTLQRALKRQNEYLEEAVASRTRELAEANRDLAEANARLAILDRSKNEFLNLISHEFRTPLNGLLGVGELILDEMALSDENAELRKLFSRSRRRILSILDDALLLTQIDVNGKQFKPVLVSMHAALSLAIEQTTDFAASRRVVFRGPRACPEFVLADETLLVKGLESLLETAVKFSSEDEAVEVSTRVLSGCLEILVESNGKIIPGHLVATFFDLFSISESSTPGRDLGLGPSMAYRVLSLFGASVAVANRDPSGIRLTISFKDAGFRQAQMASS
jgi:two-component system, sensor histidine kinase and response regulator